MSFMASYENYPGGHALKDLHQIGKLSSLSVSLLEWYVPVDLLLKV